jgi:TPR repeat protein
LVNVIPANDPWATRRGEAVDEWKTLLRQTNGDDVLVSVLSLHEELDAADVDVRWTEATADELTFAAVWAADPWRDAAGPESPPGPYTLLDTAGESEQPSFQAAFERWLDGTDAALCWIAPPDVGALSELFARPPEGAGGVVAAVPAAATVASDHASEPERARIQGIRRLLEGARLVVPLDPPAIDALSYDVSPPGARPGLLPPETDVHALPDRARVIVAWPTQSHDPRLWRAVTPEGVSALWRANEQLVELGRLAVGWNKDQALALFERASLAGDKVAKRELALLHLDRGDREKAQLVWEEVAATNDLEEIEELAGVLRERDTDAARVLYEAAAKRGSPRAMRRLAADLDGSDPEAAGSWAEQLVQTGDARQIERLAGDLRATNVERARRLYDVAAERGSPTAIGWLIVDSLEGAGDRTVVVGDLIDRLVDNASPAEIKRVAAAVLAQHPDAAAEWIARARMPDTKPEAATAIADALREVDPELAESLKHGSANVDPGDGESSVE